MADDLEELSKNWESRGDIIMKEVITTDKRGYRHRVFVRDKDGDGQVEFGIPAGPPDIESLDCEYLKREINRVLIENRLFTWDDVQRSPVGLNAVVTIVKRAVSGLYRESQKQDEGNIKKIGG